MTKVILHKSMSLDGFVAGPDVSIEQPMGVGGERLHRWLFQSNSSPVDADVARGQRESTGAVVLGRRTFEVGVGQWEDTPYPVPSFVLTHTPREDLQMSSAAFAFVGSVDEAVTRAAAAAGDRDIALMGAEVAQQFLHAGLLDEVHLQIVPILLGSGTRLFDELGGFELQPLRVLESPTVTHIHYRVQ